MTVLALDGVIRRYDWGSTTAIPELLGLAPDGRPAAELWFGAHPDSPSPTTDGAPLDAVIAADPHAALGRAVIDRFGPRLPYLLKVLAAGTALSIQVHPTLDQARAGVAAEDAAGLARDAPERNYRDANHKPELICALTPFEALCGFRPVEQTLRLLRWLAVPELDFLTSLLEGDDPLRTAFTAVLTQDDASPLSTALATRVGADPVEELRGVALAARDFPGDVGVVLAVLLNYIRLEPGEAIYLGAGLVHSYLRGNGIEIMANSDNVLRCGLTPKHVDVPELLTITDFSELADPRLPAVEGSFDVAVRDFRLTCIDVEEPLVLDDPGPTIVLCAAGRVLVGDVTLAAGRAAFVPAAEPAVTLDGAGRVFVAGTRA